MSPALRAQRAVLIVFACAGGAFATWASRLPDIKAALELTPSGLGVILLAGSLGAVIGLPASGWITHRFGAARTVTGGAALQFLGQTAAGFAALAGSKPGVMAGAAVAGLGVGVWDVAMNLEGAVVEQARGRTIMPWFHAAFSAGTVAAALLGTLAVALDVPITWHLTIGTALCSGIAIVTTRDFLPPHVETDEDGAPVAHEPLWRAWLEPRTLLIGLMVMVASFTEGTANDWVGVAMREGYHLPAWAGVLGFAVFLSFMTAGRLVGPRLLDRYGRVVTLRILFAAATIGCALLVFGGPVLAYVGAAIWGVGASLGFPVGMSAAADDPRRASARMSVVSTVGYLAFLGGPPFVGFLGDHVGVLRALLAVGAAAVIAFLVVPAAREPQRRVTTSHDA